MPTYTTPGVYVNDAALTSLRPATPGTTTAVFFGCGCLFTWIFSISDWPTFPERRPLVIYDMRSLGWVQLLSPMGALLLR